MDDFGIDALPPRPVLARGETIGVSMLCDTRYPKGENPEFDRIFDQARALGVSWDAERHAVFRDLMSGSIESVWSRAHIFPFGELSQRDSDAGIPAINPIAIQVFRRHCTDLPQMSDADVWKQHHLFAMGVYGESGGTIPMGRDNHFLVSMIGRLASSPETPYSEKTRRFGMFIAVGLKDRMTAKDAYAFGKQAMTYDTAIEDLCARVAARAVEMAEDEVVSLR
jgi:hypothetical protein